jgi:hypothetical protein
MVRRRLDQLPADERAAGRAGVTWATPRGRRAPGAGSGRGAPEPFALFSIDVAAFFGRGAVPLNDAKPALSRGCFRTGFASSAAPGRESLSAAAEHEEGSACSVLRQIVSRDELRSRARPLGRLPQGPGALVGRPTCGPGWPPRRCTVSPERTHPAFLCSDGGRPGGQESGELAVLRA